MKKILFAVLCLSLITTASSLAFDGKSASYTITGDFNFTKEATKESVPPVVVTPPIIETKSTVPSPVSTKKTSKVVVSKPQSNTKVKSVEVEGVKKSEKVVIESIDQSETILNEILMKLAKCETGAVLHESSPSIPVIPYGYLFLEIIAGASFGLLVIGTFVLLLQSSSKK